MGRWKVKEIAVVTSELLMEEVFRLERRLSVKRHSN